MQIKNKDPKSNKFKIQVQKPKAKDKIKTERFLSHINNKPSLIGPKGPQPTTYFIISTQIMLNWTQAQELKANMQNPQTKTPNVEIKTSNLPNVSL